MLFADDLSAPGRAFAVSAPLSRALGDCVWHRHRSSASSWQGLLVDPGGAPAPPGCPAANQTRRRRTPSRLYARFAKRPFGGRGDAESKRGFARGDNVGTVIACHHGTAGTAEL